MKVLCVAEKPSIARAITEILSSNQFQTRQSPNKYVKNFDFTYRLPPSAQQVRFTVTSVLGHLTQSDFDAHHKKWSNCDPFALFDAPIERFVSPEHKGIERNLQTEARGSNRLMIWTDCDREGEHIGSEIKSVCLKANRNLTVSRARFSAIIPAQIHNACRTAGALDMQQANAVETRMELDLRIGAALTRQQTLGLQPRFPQIETVISYGPCQFPTLGFVVDQYDKVAAFVPETFWYIHVTLERENVSVEFKWKRNRLFDHHTAFALYEMCADEPEATIQNIAVKPATKWKPLPLTTVELQKSGSRLLHLTPKTILDIAEKLYIRGLVSYPRTETDQFDPAFDHQALIEKQINDASWGGFASRLKNEGGFQTPRNGKKNDKAHPPIHPTAHANDLASDEKRVYELITRRYLACCSKNAVGKTTTIDVLIAEEEFTATGLVILERNYLEVYIYDKWSGHTLPDFQVGETFLPSVCELNDGTTTRPNLLTEADLVGLMDKNGIGTDATIAEHIARIIDRSYVFKSREGNVQYLLPSTLGIGLVEGYNAIGLDKSLSKPQLRRETEHRMSQICDGSKSKHEVLHQTIEEYREVFIRSKQAFNLIADTVGKYMNPPDDAYEDDHDGNDGNDGSGGGGRGGARGGRRGRGADNNQRAHRRGGAAGRGDAALGANRSIDDDSEGDGRPGGGRGNGRGTGTRGSRATARKTTTARASKANTGKGRADTEEQAEHEEPTCRCGEEVVERTVSKEGPNKGRKFYACPKPQSENSCGFQGWADEVAGQNRPSAPTAKANTGKVRASAEDQVGQDKPTCRCGGEVVERTVSKEGPNKGRKFYACPKPQNENSCGFQGWADEVGIQSNSGGQNGLLGKRPPTGSVSERSSSRPRITPSSDSREEMRCGCNLEANRKTVAKEGPNKGRVFWCCSKVAKAAQCKFFKWADEMSHDFAPVAGPSGTARTGSDQVCFKCGESGHWSNACPNPSGQQRSNAENSNYTCFTCNQPGHLSNSCPQKNSGIAQESRGANGGGECYQCGQTGHWASACPQGNSTSTRGARRGASRGVKKRGRGRGRGRSRGTGKSTNDGNFDTADEYG